MSSPPAAKKPKVDADVPDHIAVLSDPIRKSLVEIDSVQGEIDEINEKASDEILKIEQKYNALRIPYYEKRTNLTKEVPNFWPQAILNHPQLNCTIPESEMSLLHALHYLEVEEADDIKNGFTIRFYFKPNDFFENEVIEKEYTLGEEPCSNLTDIKWKEGKNLLDTMDAIKGVTFFQWVASETDPNNDELAELIKDDLWPNPVQYFLCPDVGDGDDDYEIADEGESDEEEQEEESDEN